MSREYIITLLYKSHYRISTSQNIRLCKEKCCSCKNRHKTDKTTYSGVQKNISTSFVLIIAVPKNSFWALGDSWIFSKWFHTKIVCHLVILMKIYCLSVLYFTNVVTWLQLCILNMLHEFSLKCFFEVNNNVKY